MAVPRLFTIWWLYRFYHMPDQFTLPNVLESDDLTFLLFDNNTETKLGRTVTAAWNSIPSIDRDLMVYCWTARQEKAVRDGLAHSTTSVAERSFISL